MLRWIAITAFAVVVVLGLRTTGVLLERPVASEAELRRTALPLPSPAKAEPWDGALNVPHFAQEPQLCVPTAAAMVLSYYGDPQPPRLLKALASGLSSVPEDFRDFTLTYYRDLIRGLKRIGYDWEERTFPNTSQGFGDGMARIEAEIAARRPVLVDVSIDPKASHTFVVAGADPTTQMLYVVDPLAPEPGRRRMSYRTFEQVWNESALGGDFRGLVLTRPKAPL